MTESLLRALFIQNIDFTSAVEMKIITELDLFIEVDFKNSLYA